jgi:hypothetical protein
MASVDKLISIGLHAINSITNEKLYGTSLYELIYNIHTNKANFLAVHITGYFFNFFLYLGSLTFGYLIAALYYRMNKVLKITVSVGVPCFVFIVVPFIDYTVTMGATGKSFNKLFDIAFGISSRHSVNAILTCITVFLIFSALFWLLLRRAPVNGNQKHL